MSLKFMFLAHKNVHYVGEALMIEIRDSDEFQDDEIATDAMHKLVETYMESEQEAFDTFIEAMSKLLDVDLPLESDIAQKQ